MINKDKFIGAVFWELDYNKTFMTQILPRSFYFHKYKMMSEIRYPAEIDHPEGLHLFHYDSDGLLLDFDNEQKY